MRYQYNRVISLIVVLVALAWLAPAASAADREEAAIKVKEATLMVSRFMKSDDQDMVRKLLRKCKAVVLVPDMVKAGFVVGAKYGRGVILARRPDGTFSPPAFVTLGGGNIGFQIGAQAVDLFMLVMKERGLKSLLKHQMKFGVDASVAAGPVGRRGEASLSDASLNADIYSYSATKGAFAGVSVEGGGMDLDPETNQAYYGQKVGVAQIIGDPSAVTAPAEATQLQGVLASYAR